MNDKNRGKENLAIEKLLIQILMNGESKMENSSERNCIAPILCEAQFILRA